MTNKYIIEFSKFLLESEQRLKDNLNVAVDLIKHPYTYSIKNDSKKTLITIKEKNKRSSAILYWYNDDNTTVYISNIFVRKNAKTKGIGTKLMNLCEQIAKKLGSKNISLWVKKDSWIHDWYKRLGYKDLMDYKGNNKFIWLKKSLK